MPFPSSSSGLLQLPWPFAFLLLLSWMPLALCSIQQRTLMDHLFEQYKKELRPVLDERTVTNVAVQLYFKQIQKVKENDQIITVYCWLEEYWRDEFLRWDPSEFGGLSQLHVPADMIWRPDLLVYNSANMNVRESEMMTNALVQHDGRVSLFRAVITDITCHLNLVMLLPAEEVPELWLGDLLNNRSSTNSSSEGLGLSTNKRGGFASGPDSPLFMHTPSLTHYIPNMEWTLIDFRTRSNLKWYDCCPNPYPDICYYFAIKRNPSYYLFTLIMPSALITAITVVGFFTPHSTTGENTEKVSLGVTSLLSLALILMMVSDKLPATSNTVPVLGQYYIGLICIQFTATYVTTWTLGLQMQGNTGRSLPCRLRAWIMRIDLHSNCLLRNFLGRELRCIQRSIRKRMRNFSELNTDDDARSPHHFLFRPNQKSPLMMKPLMRQMNGHSSGKIIAMNGIGQNGWPNTIKNCEDIEHICATELGIGGGSLSLHPNRTDAIRDILATVRSIRLSLLGQEQQRIIRAEWRMLSRMLEKVLKLCFSAFTVTFAVYMLYDEQSPPLISDEWILAHSKQ